MVKERDELKANIEKLMGEKVASPKTPAANKALETELRTLKVSIATKDAELAKALQEIINIKSTLR